MSGVRLVSEIASEMALVPLLWILWKRPGAAWWWLAIVYGVSWVADTAALRLDPWLVGAVYPVSQAAIVGAVFLSRKDALILVLLLVIVGLFDLWWRGNTGPDILLRTVAWLSIVGIIYQIRQLERLRIALIVAFGLGWLAWMYYASWPGWWSWGTYQVVRLAGIVLFCWASLRPKPRFMISA